MIIKYDLDGTICSESTWCSRDEAHAYETRTPCRVVIETMRELIDAGHVVIIETARRERWRTLTEQWLDANGVWYHYLFMNKVKCDRVIDDQARTNAQVRAEYLSARKRAEASRSSG